MSSGRYVGGDANVARVSLSDGEDIPAANSNLTTSVLTNASFVIDTIFP